MSGHCGSVSETCGPNNAAANTRPPNRAAFRTPTAQAGGGLPFRIVSADLKSQGAGGTVLFNPAAGRVESSDMSIKLGGKLTIEIGGMSTDVELQQDQKTTVKTSVENPVKK